MGLAYPPIIGYACEERQIGLAMTLRLYGYTVALADDEADGWFDCNFDPALAVEVGKILQDWGQEELDKVQAHD